MPGHFRKVPKTLPGKYQKGVVPRMTAPPGREHYEGFPEEVAPSGSLHTTENREVSDMPAYVKVKGKQYYTHAHQKEGSDKWTYGHWLVDEKGSVAHNIPGERPIDTIFARENEEEYEGPESALNAARKHIKQINEEEE